MDRADYDLSVSNEELLELCKFQDQEALRVLLKRHERPIYSLLYRMLNSSEDAEEALAEVFVKVWKSAAGFKNDCKFTTWLYKIASNTARDILRSRKSRREVSIEDVIVNEANLSLHAQPAPDPARSVIIKEDREAIEDAVNQLSEEDRLIVNLYHFQDRTYEEITEITGISAANLKVKLFRARQRIRKLCAKHEGADDDELRTNTTESSGLQPGAA